MDFAIGKIVTLRFGPVKTGQVPNYTSNLDAALELAQLVASQERYGFSWEPGLAHACIGDGDYCAARTAPLALCAASLEMLSRALRDHS